MNATNQNIPATELRKFYCPENFFVVDPDAPALQDGVLGIQIQRIGVLIEAAKDQIENQETMMATCLMEMAIELLDQMSELVSHDEFTRRQAQKPQATTQAEVA